jgi:hypothetical protein
MKVYVTLIEKNLIGKTVESLGSFSKLILDGRNSRDIWISDGMALLNKEKQLKPWYIGFRIYKGDFKQSTCIYEYTEA